MERKQAVKNAIDAVHWRKEPFEMGSGDLASLAYSISASVGAVTTGSMRKIHRWLWPMLAPMSLGDTKEFGAVRITMAVDDPAQDRDLAEKAFVVECGGRRIRMIWVDMDGNQSGLGMSVENPASWIGFEPVAWTDISQDGKRFRGGLNGAGDDVETLFSFFSILAAEMPTEIRDEPGDYLADTMEAEHQDLIDVDGGLAGSAATEVYRAAEQRAANVVFRWAAPHFEKVARFLDEHDIRFDTRSIDHCDGGRTVCLAPSTSEGRTVIMDSQFPHERLFDRYITWFDGDLKTVSSYALSEGETFDAVRIELENGRLTPTVSHDYPSGATSFESGRNGTLHVAHIVSALFQSSLLAEGFDPELEGVAFDLAAPESVAAPEQVLPKP